MLAIVAFCYGGDSQRFPSKFLYGIPRLCLMDKDKSTVLVGDLILPNMLTTSHDLLPAAIVYLYDACHHGI